MIPYHCNEAVLLLPNVQSCVDRSRHIVEVVTDDGAEIQLVVARALVTPGLNLTASVESDLADRRRSLRGFELISATERDYPAFVGVEARIRFVDKQRGAMFHHEFHCVVGALRLGYYGICRFEHAATCDAWMQTVLQSVKLRD